MSGIRRGAAAALVVPTIGMAAGVSRAEPEAIAVPAQGCPGLYVLAVQGTGQSAPDAPVSLDSGMLAAVLEPVLSTARGLVARAYVPYEAAFGGAVPGGLVPYSVSVTGGLDHLRQMAAAVARQCPGSELALVGYSQGAHVVSMFAQEVGQGRAEIPADRVAAVALIADPTRRPGAPLFPGDPGRRVPAPAPGTAGAEVARLQPFPQPRLAGGGIGPDQDIAADFGALSGRVASLCMPGDLACDAPADLPMLRTIVNIAGQADLDPADPMAAFHSILRALQDAAVKTAVEVADRDLAGQSLGTLSLSSGKTLSQRLAEMSDPRTQPADPQARRTLLKLGTSALNTVLALTGTMLTQDEVAYIAAAADPLDGLHRLADIFVAAVRRPVPKGPAFHLFTQLFDAVAQLLDDTLAALDPEIWARYLDTGRQHGAYVFASAGERSAVQFVSEWFAALARDLSGPRLPAAATDGAPAAKPPMAQPLSTPAPRAAEGTGSAAPPAAGSATATLPGHRDIAWWRSITTDREQDRYFRWLLLFIATAVATHLLAWVWTPRQRFLIGEATRRRRGGTGGRRSNRPGAARYWRR
ncbi:cutinase family protein [Nocardia sp. CDC159]|uniref:Cutinase family protein n=1 Tax=Nocardia pulmonis TaxID=2951408 RepID=A0A9X2EB50_9NOCA|nr:MULTISPECIES: cutinase family protein [Nocardia]MCM6777109.1 cutinase family protein [Nocardia pulmonis]MCM6789994.1 cutinase family protein [Nocardia sp. CDC159]